jgi:hypothetical protein
MVINLSARLLRLTPKFAPPYLLGCVIPDGETIEINSPKYTAPMPEEKDAPPRSNSRKGAREETLLSNQLSSWAREFDLLTHPYVKGLIAALQSGKNLGSWLALDPMDYLPHEPSQRQAQWKAVADLISLLRNTMIFAPVALTWLAISKTTSAFALYTKNNSVNVVNFLDFWQNGYGVLGQTWILSHIAILDFELIASVIVLTLVTFWLNQRERVSQRKLEDRFWLERTELALGISLHAHQTSLKNLKNLRSRLASELNLHANVKILKKIRDYGS